MAIVFCLTRLIWFQQPYLNKIRDKMVAHYPWLRCFCLEEIRYSSFPIDLSHIKNLVLGYKKVTLGSFHLRGPDLMQS